MWSHAASSFPAKNVYCLSGSSFLEDKYLPKVDVSGSEVSGMKVGVNKVIEGIYNSSVVFNCELTYQESRNLVGQCVSVELLVNDRTVASERSVLYENGQRLQMMHNISGVQVDDGGMYTCRSEMRIGERTFTSSKFFNLRCKFTIF